PGQAYLFAAIHPVRGPVGGREAGPAIPGRGYSYDHASWRPFAAFISVKSHGEEIYVIIERAGGFAE
ncbi:MAG: hypothetical protein ACRDOH_31810, partial [Streptosporangiaceae bacterium]